MARGAVYGSSQRALGMLPPVRAAEPVVRWIPRGTGGGASVAVPPWQTRVRAPLV